MVSPMEQAAVTAFGDGMMRMVSTYVDKEITLWRNERVECQSLIRDLIMLAASADDEIITRGDAPRTAVAKAYSEEMRDLTHDIEDCIERFLHQCTLDENASRIKWFFHTMMTFRSRVGFASKIEALKKRLKESRERIFHPHGVPKSSSTSSVLRMEYTQTDDPVGIVHITSALVDFIIKPAKLMVIVLEGFAGSGKTTLAREVYCSRRLSNFDCRAWVSVQSLEHKDAKGILMDIHRQIFPAKEYSAHGLQTNLKTMRYIVVIDELKIEHMVHWNSIMNTFQGAEHCGRIIVTTSTHSIANRCSSFPLASGDEMRSIGYTHHMRPLEKEVSAEIALLGRSTPELLEGSVNILRKCDGLPLALASVANHLSSQNEPTGQICEELSSTIGAYLDYKDEVEPNFCSLRNALLDCYTALSDQTVRTCLLYLSIFPSGQLLRRSVIVRRWCAEGYARNLLVSELKMADSIFDTFIDRHITLPADPSNNRTVKTCKTQGIIHAFLLHKSSSENFILPFDARRKKTRHLYIDETVDTQAKVGSKKDLCSVRSLTVRGSAKEAIADFSSYKVIRVLDLEACDDVDDSHIKGICNLWNLRYLSLGPNVSTLTREISKLKLLETLDISKTMVNIVPLELLSLPKLLHLVGRVKLAVLESKQLHEFVGRPKKSVLQTLVGFESSGKDDILDLIEHMPCLQKVKIWAVEPTDRLKDTLPKAIQKFTKAPIKEGDFRSLAVDVSACPEASFHALRDVSHWISHDRGTDGSTAYLTELKLYGTMAAVPEFVSQLTGLTDLYISTRIVTTKIMDDLGSMDRLLYLKLATSSFETYSLMPGQFKSLRRLRVVAKHEVVLPNTCCNALPDLVSLQLHVKKLSGLGGINIDDLKGLREVSVDSQVSAETREAWEQATKNHINMPSLQFVENIDGRDTNEIGSSSSSMRRN